MIDEVLISYHLDRKSPDYNHNIFPLGSTFDKVLKTVEKARKNSIVIRTNTVIGRFNLDVLDYIVDDIISYLRPKIVNFLPVNLFDESEKNGMSGYIDYVRLRPVLKRNIGKLREKLQDSLVFVRYMPFCDMEGYEQHIAGTLQHMYDFFDWNIELCGQNILQYLGKYESNDDVLKYLGRFGSRTKQKALQAIQSSYEKPLKCLGCKYFMICDGVEKTDSHILFDQVRPSAGKMITDFMEFIGNATEKTYVQLYGRH